MIRAVHIDDDPLFLQTFRVILDLFPEIELIGSFSDLEEALRFVDMHPPDLVFLDIQLGESSGFSIVSEFNARAIDVAFLTAYEHFAIPAFNTHALGYILKPPAAQSIMDIIHRLHQKQKQTNNLQLSTNSTELLPQTQHHMQNQQFPKRIFIPMVGNTIVVKLGDLMIIEAKSNYSSFTMSDGGTYMSSRHLKVYSDMINGHPDFIRIYRSYIINKNYISNVVRSKNNKTYIVMDNNRELEISMYKKDDIMKLLAF